MILLFTRQSIPLKRPVVWLDLLIYLHIMLTYVWNCSPFARKLQWVWSIQCAGSNQSIQLSYLPSQWKVNWSHVNSSAISYQNNMYAGTGYLPVTSSLYRKSLPVRRSSDAESTAACWHNGSTDSIGHHHHQAANLSEPTTGASELRITVYQRTDNKRTKESEYA